MKVFAAEKLCDLTKSLSDHFDMERDIVANFNPSEEIFIKNPEELRRKILTIRSDGKENLNILTDFDSTLTKKVYNNLPTEHSFNAMEKVLNSYILRKKLLERILSRIV